MTTVVRRVRLLVMHLLLLPAGVLLVWWWATPVDPGSWSSQLPSFFWPYMVALTAVPGAATGLLEARLLRRRHALGAVLVGLAASVVGLWLPLVYVTHDPADVVPVETGDVVASTLLWALFWAGNVVALFVALRRSGAAVDTSGSVTATR